MSLNFAPSLMPLMPTTPRPLAADAWHSASISSLLAQRLGMGCPSAPRWVMAKLVAKPAAPASMASPISADIFSISSAVAMRVEASSPIT